MARDDDGRGAGTATHVATATATVPAPRMSARRPSTPHLAVAPPAPVPDLDAYVALSMHFDLDLWARRHAAGEVPDATPYGLHKLADHGVRPHFRRPTHNGVARWASRKVRNRLSQTEIVEAAVDAVRGDRGRTDAVLCWDERTGVPAVLLPGSPPVVSGGAWLADPDRLSARVRHLTRLALPRMGALFHFCHPMGRAVEAAWGLSEGTVRRVTMGVDADFYTAQPPAEQPGTVVSIGDDRNRDHTLLVRAVERVHRGGVPVRLELATLQDVALPEHLGVVHRRRMEGAIRPLYQRSSVVAIAARPTTAGSGLTVLMEAMASARPVVLTANPGFEEYVEHGVTGLLVPPGDDEAFADAIASLLRDPEAAAAMGRAGRRVVESRLTTGHVAADVAELLRSVR